MDVKTTGLLRGRYTLDDVAMMVERHGIPATSRSADFLKRHEHEGPAAWTYSGFVHFPLSPGAKPDGLVVVTTNLAHRFGHVTNEHEVTSISMSHSTAAESVVRAVVEQTGGWFLRESGEEWVAVPKSLGPDAVEVMQNRARTVAANMARVAAARGEVLGLPASAFGGLADELAAIMERRLTGDAPAVDSDAPSPLRR